MSLCVYTNKSSSSYIHKLKKDNIEDLDELEYLEKII